MYKVSGLHSWLTNLDAEVIRALEEKSQQRDYSAGEYVYKLGDPSSYCYVVESGRIRMCNYTADGHEIVMMEFFDGDCFGESSTLENLPRFNHACAVQDSRLSVISRDDFLLLYDKYPQIARSLNTMLAGRLRVAYGNAEDAAGLALRDRVARLVLRRGYSLEADPRGHRVISGLSHEVVANMLGSSRQAVSRELKALERDGFLELHYGKIVVSDIEALGSAFGRLISDETVVPDYQFGH